MTQSLRLYTNGQPILAGELFLRCPDCQRPLDPGDDEPVCADCLDRRERMAGVVKKPEPMYVWRCPQCGWYATEDGGLDVSQHADPCDECQRALEQIRVYPADVVDPLVRVLEEYEGAFAWDALDAFYNAKAGKQ